MVKDVFNIEALLTIEIIEKSFRETGCYPFNPEIICNLAERNAAKFKLMEKEKLEIEIQIETSLKALLPEELKKNE